MTVRKWKKKEVERYCKRILGYTPEVKMVSGKSIKPFRAIATSFNAICLAERKFERDLLFHECGHLMGHHKGSRHWHWTGEKSAHLNAIWRALDMGWFEVARELVRDMDEWTNKGRVDYIRAAEAVKEELGL